MNAVQIGYSPSWVTLVWLAIAAVGLVIFEVIGANIDREYLPNTDVPEDVVLFDALTYLLALFITLVGVAGSVATAVL